MLSPIDTAFGPPPAPASASSPVVSDSSTRSDFLLINALMENVQAKQSSLAGGQVVPIQHHRAHESNERLVLDHAKQSEEERSDERRVLC